MISIDPSIRALAAALAIGLMIGLERGWRARAVADGGRVSGFRTYGLIGLAGGLAAQLPGTIAAMLAGGVAVSLMLGYGAVLLRGDGLSVTGTIVGLLTFALGFVAGSGRVAEALGAGAVVLLILSSRAPLHAMLKGMSEAEIESAARFAIVALVILPLLPDASYGPYQAWNPHRIWMVVVLVLALSFAGYVAARRFAPERGVVVLALTGALVSSTAVTASYARQLRAGTGSVAGLTAGIGLASLVMLVRVQVITAMLAPFASASLALVMLPALAVALPMALLGLRRGEGGAGATPAALGNPLDFGPALLLAGLVAILSVVARWAQLAFGDRGIAVLLGVTGMMDVDAAVLTLSGFPAGTIDGWTGGMVLAVPIIANTAIKGVMALTIAGGAKGRRAAAPLFAAVLASAGGIAIAAWLR